MIGAIIGDIAGSRFEFYNYLGKDFEFLTNDCRFTDDTVMTCAVAQALMDCGGDFSGLSEKAVAAMQRIGRQFPGCGYGRKFFDWMFSDDPQPYNSCGNGSAMRISPVGFLARDVDEAKELAAAVTRVSHDHPEGMRGAEAIAVAIVMVRKGSSKREIREAMEGYYELSETVDGYRENWQGHGKEICQVSVPQALACFFEGESYEDVIRNCISIGGDSDTIAAIAGGLAEAFYGVPQELEQQVWRYLPPVLAEVCRKFEEKASAREAAVYDEIDEYPVHEGCIRIPCPETAYGWSRIYYDPEDSRFFCENYSTGAIDDDSTRYHGTYPLSLDEVKREVSTGRPEDPEGIRVLNDVIMLCFPGEKLLALDSTDKYAGLSAEEYFSPHICPVCCRFWFPAHGSYDICEVCGWEDDGLQETEPDLPGANWETLNEYRALYNAGMHKASQEDKLAWLEQHGLLPEEGSS